MSEVVQDNSSALGPLAGIDRWWSEARREVWVRAATHSICAVVPVGFSVYIVVYALAHHAFAVDFDSAFWPAGVRVLHGLSPYASPNSVAAHNGFAFVYPAPGALLFAAFAWLPRVVADAVFTAICMAAALGTLSVLGVRDWRLYGLTMLWPPVISGWQTANVSLLLAFGIAVAWRARNRPLVAGAFAALLISLKIFLWPLVVWLLLTRRWRACAWALACGLAVNIIAWAVVGFGQVSAYADLVRSVTKVEQAAAYTPLALALRLGAGATLAYVMAGVAVVLVAMVCVIAARHCQDSAVLLGVIALSLLATPVVWRHYFVLLLVPIAIMRPRLSAAWTIPLLTFVCPVTAPALWQLLLVIGAMSLLVFVLLRWPEPVTIARAARSGPALSPEVATATGDSLLRAELRRPGSQPARR